MLRQRIITALLLVPLVIWAVLYWPSEYLAVGIALVVLAGAREWAVLSGITAPLGQAAYLLLVGLGLGAGWLVTDRQPGVLWVVLLTAIWWGGVALRVWRYAGPQSGGSTGYLPFRALEGLVVLVPCWIALVYLHSLPAVGKGLVLFLFVLIWAADSAAYFAGRQWGKTKLAPQVSPGKTREGVYGALVGAAVCALAMGFWMGLDSTDWIAFVALCILTATISVVGDLFESLVKRDRGVKDSGSLLPGHGGILDRVDSLTAASPVFLLGWMLLS